MSEENVEIVQQALTEFDRSQRLTESWAPDFVWEVGTYPGAPGPSEYRGWSGFYEFLEDWLDPYDEWEQEFEDVFDAGPDLVLAVLRQRGRLSGSEDWVELHYAILYTVEGGLIRRARVFSTPEAALEAAGLSG